MIRNIFKVALVTNVFEWYEFCIYGYLAEVIGYLFFNTTNSVVAVIEAFSLFSISYLMRPLGSLFFGYLGDRFGRNQSLTWSLFLMTLPTAFIGMLPTYNHLGIVSTLLLVMLRLIQGFAAGGELPISACYVYEASPQQYRSLLCSAVSVSAIIGVLSASLIASILFLFFDHSTIMSWAWRIPFLLGIPLSIFIFCIRRNLVERPIMSDKSSSLPRPLLGFSIFKNPDLKQSLLQAVLLVSFLQTSFYILFVWMPSYLIYFLHMPSRACYISNTLALLALATSCLGVSYLSRFFDRRFIMTISILGIVLVIYPLFAELKYFSFGILVSMQLLFAVLLSGVSGLMMETLGNLFPRTMRCRGMAIGFTLPTAFLGGTAPTLCSYFIHKTGILVFPAVYIICLGCIALPAAIRLKKTDLSFGRINSNATQYISVK